MLIYTVKQLGTGDAYIFFQPSGTRRLLEYLKVAELPRSASCTMLSRYFPYSSVLQRHALQMLHYNIRCCVAQADCSLWLHKDDHAVLWHICWLLAWPFCLACEHTAHDWKAVHHSCLAMHIEPHGLRNGCQLLLAVFFLCVLRVFSEAQNFTTFEWSGSSKSSLVLLLSV